MKTLLRCAAIAATVAVLPTSAWAQAADPEPPLPPEVGTFNVAVPGMPTWIGAGGADFMAAPVNIMGRLFPPSLIMRQQKDIALSDEQAEAIKAQMRDFQSRVVDVQWDLQSNQATLDSVLDADRIDGKAAESAIDAVLRSENALKKAHLTMLINIRNVLNAEQVGQLEKAQRGHFFVHPLDFDPPGDVKFETFHMP